jgi:branched-chain amino acid transport system ATP-binding protein
MSETHLSAGAPALVVDDLHKSFGALKASNGISLDVRAGEIHAVIGPNGAGKSTLISQICGEIRPDRGHVLIGGDNMDANAAHRRARHGLGRSFQITQLCAEFTALENVILSVMSRSGRLFDFWRNPRKDAACVAAATEWLGRVGLEGQRNAFAGEMAHGERRQLEMAVALAREPKVLLLDEPMAGMGPEESARMTALLQSLKGRYAVLLVEHDMEAVFALADRISVLVYGTVVFTGPAGEARADPTVRAAYLGEEAC